MTRDLVGAHRIERPSFLRQLARDAFTAVEGGHSISAFLELDVTEPLAAIDALKERGVRVSLFAHVVRSIAVAISEHPDLNAIPHRGGRVARFEDVDVAVPVEVDTEEGRFPLQLVIRRAHAKSAPAIYAEIAQARDRQRTQGTIGEEDAWARRTMRLARFVPRRARVALLRAMIADARLVKRRSGTTLVTSVGKLGSIPGFVAPLPSGPRAATFAVGSVIAKPVVREGAIVPRSILALTAVFDHDLVDGGPAARFAMRLKELVESGAALA